MLNMLLIEQIEIIAGEDNFFRFIHFILKLNF
jgi:hypothetical protein